MRRARPRNTIRFSFPPNILKDSEKTKCGECEALLG
jgi:hypothetical protein